MGLIGVAVAGTVYADMDRPWIDLEKIVDVNKKMKNNDHTDNGNSLDLIRYATLAANGHNTQPWRFDLDGTRIQIHPDMTRRLPVVDAQDRELWISLGCALENMLIAARETGFSASVIYPDENNYIEVELTEGSPAHSELFDAIPERQNSRSLYDGLALPEKDLTRLQGMPLEPGITVKYLHGQSGLALSADFIRRSTLIQYAGKKFLHELVLWLRFNKKEALASMDGLYSRCSGNPEVPRFLGKLFVEGIKPEQQAAADSKKVMSSAGVVVIASNSDSRSDWVRTGQVYERLALFMTSMNIKSALLNQPVEVDEIRGEFGSAAGLEAGKPQLLMRYGFTAAAPASMRRPVEQIIEIKK